MSIKLEGEPTIDRIVYETGEYFHKILREGLYELPLNRKQLEERVKQKKELRNALKNCGIGDKEAKAFVKDMIVDMLLKKYRITEESIGKLIPFGETHLLSCQDKFEILIYHYKKVYGENALKELILQNDLLEKSNCGKEVPYQITKQALEQVYFQSRIGCLDYWDGLQVLSQRIYQQFKGLGVVDEIRDQKIDGLSGGVSGYGEEEQSVWIFFQGKSIHLEFLSFGSRRELERICRNIYRYGQPGQLSESRGYLVNETADHARVVVARPPFSENWVFFVRKFDSMEHKCMEELLTDEKKENAINLVKWIIKSCQITAVTGAQGSGKTTLLMALIGFIPAIYTLRIQELAFELHLRKLYPERNIVSFQETGSVSGQEGLDLQKKTDGVVNILGEVSNDEISAWMIQMGLTASLFTIFTHHAKTTKALIQSLRNSLLSTGRFQNERIAQQQTVDVVRFDIHMNKDREGHRYIERINEIVPLEKEDDQGNFFQINELLYYEDGKYHIKNCITEYQQKQMKEMLSAKEQEEFEKDMGLQTFRKESFVL